MLTRGFLLCAAANLAQGISFDLFLHLPGFLAELGADAVRIGLLFGWPAIAAIAVRPALGRVMDLRGRRPVILGGAVLNALACALYPTIRDLGPEIFAVRTLHGLAQAALFTALFTDAADRVPAARRTEGLALFGVSGVVPIALGGLIGDAVLAVAGYGELFWAAFGFSVAAFALVLPLRDAPRVREAGAPRRGFLAAVWEPSLRPLWGVGLAFAMALAAAFTFLKTFVMETGLGSVGLFFTTYVATALVLRVPLARLPDRVGPKRVLHPALWCLGLGFLCLARAATTRDVALAGILSGAGHGYAFPVIFSLVVSRARESERGAAMSLYTALFDAGMLLGGPALGAVLRVGGYPAMFATAAVLPMLASIGFAIADRGRGVGGERRMRRALG